MTIRTGTDFLNFEKVYAWLAEAYWAKNRSRETINRSFQNSLVVTAWIDDEMVGLARVVTDYATFAWLCDVFVDPEVRGQGIGKALVGYLLARHDLEGVRWMLGTRDAHSLYERFGFVTTTETDRWMVRGFAPRPPLD